MGRQDGRTLALAEPVALIAIAAGPLMVEAPVAVAAATLVVGPGVAVGFLQAALDTLADGKAIRQVVRFD